MIEEVHALGKPFRFWATPDSSEAWKQLMELKVDVLNTDHPAEVIAFITRKDNR